MAKNEELRPEPQPAPTHYPEEKKEEKTLEEQMEEIKSWNLDTSHERPPIDAEPVQKTVLPEIEMLATPFKLWSGFCDHEVESMEAIGGFITDQAEEVANDDDTGSFWGNVKRDFCKGIIGDDDVTPASVIGAAMRGGGNFISHGWEGIWTCVGHPYKTTASAGAGIGYAVTHGEEVIDGIEAYWEEFKNMNLNEQLTVGVETVCDVVLAYKSAKELVNVAKGARKAKNAKKLKAAGALETGGVEGAEIAAEAGEAGGIVGSEGGVAVEGAAGEAGEAIEGVAGKGKIRIESAGNSIKNNLIKKIKDIRGEMPNNNLAKRGNMAVADVDVPGIKDNFLAHSKINSEFDKGADIAEFSYLKPENERIFTTYVDDKYPRYHDTEAKILEDIASQITDSNISGTINLYSELPCCQSCSNIILEFRRKFPNIKLNVYVE